MKHALRTSVAAFALVVSPTSVLAKKPTQPATPKPEMATLVLPIPSGQFGTLAGSENGYDVLDRFKLPKITETGDNLNALQGICNLNADGKPQAGPNSFLIALFGAVLKPLFGLMFHKADEGLDEKIKGYKGEWEAGTTISAFGANAQGEPEPLYRCLRVVRVNELPDVEADTAVVNFDVLFLVHWIKTNKVWQLVPLRVETTNPIARGQKVNFAMSLAGNAVGVKEGQGHVEAISETVILTGKYKPKGDFAEPVGERSVSYPVSLCDLLRTGVVAPASLNVPKDMAKPDQAKCVVTDRPTQNALIDNVAALPVFGSIPSGNTHDGSAVNLVFKVAEAGKGPRLKQLEEWKTYLGKAGDGISDALTSAISGLLGSKE